MPTTVVVECPSACTATLELVSTGPFHLTVADGLVLSGIVVGMWFVGFGIRALMAVLKGNSDG